MLLPLLGTLATGFTVGAGLIIAIGAQNALVLTHGLKRQHHILIASTCFLVDVILIIAGVAGMGLLLSNSPAFLAAARWGGAIFLAAYGLRSFHRARQHQALRADNNALISWQKALLTALAISLLNPHVYLDTVLLLGSIGGQLPEVERPWFSAGAILASFSWFFGLSLLAGKLAPVFRLPRAWQALDILVGIMMWSIALTLIWAT